MKHGRRKQERQRRKGTSGSSTASATSTASAWTTQSAEAAEGPAGGTRIEPWWKREPERLQFELEELDAAGIEYQVNEAAKARGSLIIDLEIILADGEKVQLQARFPDLYPYFRFEILAPELDLPYHQHPFGKQLCILGRATRTWNTTNTLAEFIKTQVPRVLATARMVSLEEASGLEEHQGEPFSDYYSYLDNSLLLIDSSWNLESANRGSLTIGFPERRQRGLEIRGAILEIRDERNHVIAEAEAEIIALFPRAISCRWIKTDVAPRAGNPELFWSKLYEQAKQLETPSWQTLDGFRYDLVGVVFPEEHHWRSGKTDGWVFAVRATPIGGTGTGDRYHYMVRAGRTGRNDLIERMPELNGVQHLKVAVIGSGALGAPSCIEMARCGVGQLRILDYDFVDPATVARWPLGISAAGKSKVSAIETFIASNYPFTKVISYQHRIGMCREVEDQRSDVTLLRKLFDGADLIYDASAEIGINHLLSDMATESQIPYICLSTTYGAWGGRLIRVRPNGKTMGCWMCHQWAIEKGLIPSSPSDPKGEVQPAGCADPAFTGTGFDVTDVALAGVRLAIGTLQMSIPNGYPDVDWDVAVLSLRDDKGRVTVPHWEVFPLERHPSCENHKAHFRHSMASSARP